jgi:proliferating cell nuclear antigen
MTFEATINKQFFQFFIDTIHTIADESNIKISEDGIEACTNDAARVALSETILLPNAFIHYKADNHDICLDIKKINDILSTFDKDSELDLVVDEKLNEFIIKSKGLQYNIKLYHFDKNNSPEVPNIDLSTKVKVPPSPLYKTMKSANKISNLINFEHIPENELVKINAENEDSINIDIDRNTYSSLEGYNDRATYNLDYMEEIFKVIKNIKTTTIEWKTDYPIKITTIPGYDENDKPIGKSIFLVAPRIDN